MSDTSSSPLPDPTRLAAEFDAMLARSGVTVPPARMPAVLAAYADLRAQMALLHGRYSHLDEPSNVFRLTPGGPR